MTVNRPSGIARLRPLVQSTGSTNLVPRAMTTSRARLFHPEVRCGQWSDSLATWLGVKPLARALSERSNLLIVSVTRRPVLRVQRAEWRSPPCASPTASFACGGPTPDRSNSLYSCLFLYITETPAATTPLPSRSSPATPPTLPSKLERSQGSEAAAVMASGRRHHPSCSPATCSC